MTVHVQQDEQMPADVLRQAEAAEAEEAAWFAALAREAQTFQNAHAAWLSQQVTWLRSRTVGLNVALREKEEELARMRARIAAYERSEAIDQAANAEPGPNSATP